MDSIRVSVGPHDCPIRNNEDKDKDHRQETSYPYSCLTHPHIPRAAGMRVGKNTRGVPFLSALTRYGTVPAWQRVLDFQYGDPTREYEGRGYFGLRTSKERIGRGVPTYPTGRVVTLPRPELPVVKWRIKGQAASTKNKWTSPAACRADITSTKSICQQRGKQALHLPHAPPRRWPNMRPEMISGRDSGIYQETSNLS